MYYYAGIVVVNSKVVGLATYLHRHFITVTTNKRGDRRIGSRAWLVGKYIFAFNPL
jgi:hypothetical protein